MSIQPVSHLYQAKPLRLNLFNRIDGIEVLFYIYLFYSTFAIPLGLHIQFFAPLLLAILCCAALFVIDWPKYDKLAVCLIATTCIIHVLIQRLIHQIPLTASYVQPFIIWPLIALIASSLAYKPSFLNRLTVIMFVIGILLIPSLEFDATNLAMNRAQALEGSGIENANYFAYWFGFCSLVFWVWGLASSTRWKSAILWSCSLFSIAVLSLTVSRGGLSILIISMLVSLRHIKWHKMFLLLPMMGATVFAFSNWSLLNSVIAAYQHRAVEESGRFLAWPLVIRAFENEPFIGHGVDRIIFDIGFSMSNVTPHNGILFLGIASGIFPVIPFVMVFCKATIRSMRISRNNEKFLDPLAPLVFIFLAMLTSNLVFIAPWATSALIYGCINRSKAK